MHFVLSIRIVKILNLLKNARIVGPSGQKQVHCARFFVSNGNIIRNITNIEEKTANTKKSSIVETSVNSVTGLNGHNQWQ